MMTDSWDHRAHLVIAETCLRLRVPFCWRGPGSILVAGTGISDVLQRLNQDGHRVIGLEAFEMELPDIHPQLDLIFDADRSPSGAAEVSAHWPHSVWVDIVLSSHS